MTTRTDYTEHEWDTLLDLPRLAAFGAMAAEEDGPVASTRELFTAMHEMAEAARTTYPDNALIQEIVTEITEGGDEALGTKVAWEPGDESHDLGAAMLEQALATAARARGILASQATPRETAEYTAWVLAIARAGAAAAGSGFLGLVGDRVTPAEARFVADLAAALGTP